MAWGENKADQGGRHAIMFYSGSFIDRANGSQVRACGLLSWLCEQFEKVTVYTLDTPRSQQWTPERRRALANEYPSANLLVEDEGRLLVWLGRLKKLGLLLFPGRGRRILRLRLKGLTPKFEELIRAPGSLLWVNYVDNLTHLNGIEPSRCLVETHDIAFLRRAKGLRRSPFSILSLARLRIEFGALEAVAGVVGITRNESYLVRNLAPATHAFYVPDYSPLPVAAIENTGLRWDLLFVGSGNIINERGLLDLFGSDDLDLGRYSIAICGPVCALPSIKALAEKHPNVELLGFVDDLAPIYAASKACLSPTNGTGLNIKIVEALRHAKPIFATRNAMDGLSEGFESCVFPVDRGLIARLLSNPEALQSASRAASDYYKRFTASGDLADLARFVRSFIGVSCQPLAPGLRGREGV